jgi:hypothetical protein
VDRIDLLPDEVLLEIFDFYGKISKTGIGAWQSLVHVCRRWRSLVLGSPCRLNLRLVCTPKTPARDTLGIWPALPLIVAGNMAFSSGTDNVIAALRQSDRVCQVFLWGLAGWQLERVLAAMQVPFPDLTDLQLFSHSYGGTLPVIPDSFLDGSAPRLQYFELYGIPFPGLPKLLLSATHLIYLRLTNIPHSGYISPEEMVAPLSVLSSLRKLYLQFQSLQSLPDRETRRPPPSKRSILPALYEFRFEGDTEYLEDLVIFIDAPQLKTLDITFFSQIDFDCPRLAQFINCTPKLRAHDEAHVQFDNSTASVKLRCRTTKSGFDDLLINISCREQDWQLSSIEQVCNSSFHCLSTVENLYIGRQSSQLIWENDAIENILWLQLLFPFTAVKNLYLSRVLAPGIAAALRELDGTSITEVLPNLQNIFVEGLRVEPSRPLQENIGQFAAARRHSGHPIAISVWGKDWMSFWPYEIND